jgi:hypothetical protein
VIDARRHDHQVVLVQLYPHPIVVLAPHVEEAAAVEDVSDLFVLMQMLVEEHLDLVFVDVAHSLWRDGDLVAVLVSPLLGNGVDVRHGWVVVVQDAELGEVLGRDVTTRVVGLALVALQTWLVSGEVFGVIARTYRLIVEPVCAHLAGVGRS